MQKRILAQALALATGASVTGAAAAPAGIISGLDSTLQLRPRYESADVDNNLDTASALTMRTRIGLDMDINYEGLSAYAEMTNVAAAVTDYNDTDSNYPLHNPTRNAGEYDGIPDPAFTRLTQGYLQYQVADTTVRAGRQKVVLGGKRFIGAVNWRQMPQTYGAYTVKNQSVDNLTLIGGYVYQRNGIKPDLNGSTKSVLLNADYQVSDALNVTAYDYMLANIHDTMGVRLTGDVDAGGVSLGYHAEYAVQGDPSQEDDDPGALGAGNTDPTIDASYRRLAVNASTSGFTVGAGHEVLGGADSASDDAGFTTPLATLHKWQGWADVFLGRTAGGNLEGIVDNTVKAGYSNDDLGSLTAIYHDFSQDEDYGGPDDLGSELDLVYSKGLADDLGAVVKYANYSEGDTGSPADTTKYWVMLNYTP